LWCPAHPGRQDLHAGSVRTRIRLSGVARIRGSPGSGVELSVYLIRMVESVNPASDCTGVQAHRVAVSATGGAEMP